MAQSLLRLFQLSNPELTQLLHPELPLKTPVKTLGQGLPSLLPASWSTLVFPQGAGCSSLLFQGICEYALPSSWQSFLGLCPVTLD